MNVAECLDQLCEENKSDEEVTSKNNHSLENFVMHVLNLCGQQAFSVFVRDVKYISKQNYSVAI